MAEYINRGRARFEAKRYFKNMAEIQEDLDMLFCMLPAENVSPVRHGRWECCNDYHGDSILVCSECGRVCHEEDAPYCYCGAKMDLER